MAEEDKYEVLEKIGTFPPCMERLRQGRHSPGYRVFANVFPGHGSFGVIRKVRRISDGLVSLFFFIIHKTSSIDAWMTHEHHEARVVTMS